MVNEIWLDYNVPVSQRQSQQCSPSPNKVKTFASAAKVMASIFKDSEGIPSIDNLTKGQTINGTYPILFGKPKVVIMEKNPQWLKTECYSIMAMHQTTLFAESIVFRMLLILKTEVVSHRKEIQDRQGRYCRSRAEF